MDDDEDDREFSRSIVFGFFEQAEQTFGKMDDALYVAQKQTPVTKDETLTHDAVRKRTWQLSLPLATS